eukprot:13289026-Ditylum_brightwellii.AAC.1
MKKLAESADLHKTRAKELEAEVEDLYQQMKEMCTSRDREMELAADMDALKAAMQDATEKVIILEDELRTSR